MARGARRPDRGGDEHRRRRLARGRRPDAARADGPRLVPGLGRLPGGSRRRPGVGRVRRQPHAIACARETLVGPMSSRIVAYTSDQTHSSLARAARHLGFRPDQIRVLPTDAAFRLRPADVAAAMDADVAAGRLPFLVSANAGTTNTGAVDPLPELAALCRERGVWLHVDGAYGGVRRPDRARTRRDAGLELADSVTLDPHKWLAMPFEVGCLMVREGRVLERAFELHPEYLQEGRGRAHERELRGPRAPAHALQPRDQGLAVAPGIRRRRVPCRHRPRPRPHARGRAADRGRPAARAGHRGVARRAHVPPTRVPRTVGRRGGSRERGRRGDARGRRGRAPHVDRHRRAVRDPAVRPEPLVRRGRRRPCAGARRDGRRRRRRAA